MGIDKEVFEGMPGEVRAKAKACETEEELEGLLKGEGFELTDEQLEGIAGGHRACPHRCRQKCGYDD